MKRGKNRGVRNGMLIMGKLQNGSETDFWLYSGNTNLLILCRIKRIKTVFLIRFLQGFFHGVIENYFGDGEGVVIDLDIHPS